MTALAPTHSVFAFSTPKIKGDDLAIALHTQCGPTALRGGRKLWHDFAEAILAAIDGPRIVSAAPVALAKQDGRKNKLSPDKRAAYIAAFHFWREHDHSQREVAEKFGLKLTAWTEWLSRHRTELEKPSSQIEGSA